MALNLGMAKHEFSIGLMEHGSPAGARCRLCGEIVLYVNGTIPLEKKAENCPRGDVNQATAGPLREGRI